MPTLFGDDDRQKKHEYLYWEFHEQGKKQAVRFGDFKGVRLNVAGNPDGPIELYNLRDDISEKNDLAEKHPEIVEKIAGYMKTAWTHSEYWPLTEQEIPAAVSKRVKEGTRTPDPQIHNLVL